MWLLTKLFQRAIGVQVVPHLVRVGFQLVFESLQLQDGTVSVENLLFGFEKLLSHLRRQGVVLGFVLQTGVGLFVSLFNLIFLLGRLLLLSWFIFLFLFLSLLALLGAFLLLLLLLLGWLLDGSIFFHRNFFLFNPLLLQLSTL